MIQNCYPRIFKDFSPETIEIQVQFWHRSLADYAPNEAMSAFEYWINTQEYPPSLSEFKSLIAMFRNPKAFISPEKAWEVVDSAVRKFGSYNQEKAFSTFSDPIKRAVRNIGGWQKICSTELGREWDFLRKNFIESFKDVGEDYKNQELLPESVLLRLQQMTQEQPQTERLENPK